MRTRDPFPKQGRIRGEYAIVVELIDPLEAEIIRIEAQRQQAIAAVMEGRHVDADPQDLRGIPCIARGVGGTSPGTDPYRSVRD